MTDAQKKLLCSLQSLCSRQECCSRDIRAKALRRLDGDEAAADEILASLVEEKYVDDLRYASAFAREKSSLTGWGPVKIRFALSAKGIDRETSDAALAAVDGDSASEKLVKLLCAKAKTLEGDPHKRLKLIKFALTRGYGYDQVEAALGSESLAELK